jgi:hypothetical protein
MRGELRNKLTFQMNEPTPGKAAPRASGRGHRGGRSTRREYPVCASPLSPTSTRTPVRGGASQRIGSAKIIMTGTKVLTELPCVLAGMQRGSSERSHHNGGATGASSTLPPSAQPSEESWSHEQSAALADAAWTRSKAPTASTWRGVFMKASSKSTAPTRVRNKSSRGNGAKGVKPVVQDVGW